MHCLYAFCIFFLKPFFTRRRRQSAHLLEQESSYVLENPSVASFRLALLNGRWEEVEDTLPKLTFKSPEDLVKAKLCIREQKFLELLERRDQHNALVVLRTELATLGTEAKKVNKLASFMMCSSAADLCQKAHWDGAAGSSRALVLSQVQRTFCQFCFLLILAWKCRIPLAHINDVGRTAAKASAASPAVPDR